jgi:hypothetical protein
VHKNYDRTANNKDEKEECEMWERILRGMRGTGKEEKRLKGLF